MRAGGVRRGGLLHLGAAIDQPRVYDAGAYAELARLAERGALDFVTLDGTLAGPGPGPGPGLDTTGVLARVAHETGRIGLVPVVTTADGTPDTVAALDRVSGGRAGLLTRHAEEPGPARDGTGHRAEEPGPARDLAGHRTGEPGLSADGIGHPVDEPASAVRVTGGPGAPPGRVVRFADVTDRHTGAVAARHADVALIRAVNAAQAADLREQLTARAAEYGRAQGEPAVLACLRIDLGDGERAAEPGHGGGGPRPGPQGPLYRGGPVDLAELIAVWHAQGAVDGFHLVPVEPRRDLERLVNGTVAVLQHRGLFRTFYPGGTLREHLALARPPAVRFAGSAG
ncbi:FMNH2-dependent monooxygenase [Streptomyces sp. NPDC014776]|uniref:FMNH2-dependent monooxygenase n=1 Tax=Streptomyces sp. NPDC014776 TaxID=3364909 RepID=UPI0036F8B09F